MSYQDGAVVVTGAASGIGLATAQRIASGGRPVLALDLSGEVDKLAGELVQAAIGDAADVDFLQAAIGRAEHRFGSLTGAVAAAGITRAGTVDTMEPAVWDDVLRTNLTAVFLLAKVTIPAFRRAGGGCFVAIASQVGLVGYPENVAYCAAKGGVINFVRALAIDAGVDNVRANTICPGPIDTPMLREGFSQTGESMAAVTARVPLGRVGTAAEIAAVAELMLSPAGAFVTGASWTVDGGYTAQ